MGNIKKSDWRESKEDKIERMSELTDYSKIGSFTKIQKKSKKNGTLGGGRK